MDQIRVAVVGLGPIGLAVYRLLATRSWADVTGAVDVDPDLVGRDAGELSGGEPTGVQVVRTLAEAGDGDVAVLCTSSRLAVAEPLITGALDAGRHVVSTCEELSYPWHHHPDAAARVDERARRAGRVALGTGINPGYAMDALALSLSAVMERVDTVEIVRIVDAAERRKPLRAKVGEGLTVDEFTNRAVEGTIGHVGLVESAAMVAAAFGWPLDEVTETLEPVVGSEGSVLGIRHRAVAASRGAARVHLRLDMYGGADDPHDSITLTGSSTVTQRIDGIHGDTATAAVTVNVIPALTRLPAGLATMIDLVGARLRP